MGKEKCWTCEKIKNDVELRATDDRMCKQCFDKNNAALQSIRDTGAIQSTKDCNRNDSPGPSSVQLPAAENGLLHDSSVCCTLCSGKLGKTNKLTCDICSGCYHIQCLHMSKTVFDSLNSIIEVTGWVCPDCRSETRLQLRQIKCGMAKLAEEVASLRAEIQQLKSDTGQAVPPPPPPSLLASVTASDRKVSTSALAVVHRELSDKPRRQKNVVHGLHPREDVDDCDQFLQLCEDHLECKPYIDRTKCR